MSDTSENIEDLEPEETDEVVGGIAQPVGPVLPAAKRAAGKLAEPNAQPIAHPL